MTENPRIRIYANRWFAKFAAKEKISDASLADAVHRAESGLIDADPGLRRGMPWQRPHQTAHRAPGRRQVERVSLDPDLPLGREGRIRVCLRQERQACPEPVEGANLSAAELRVYRKAASVMLELGENQIETEVEAGRLVEVKDNEQG